MCIHFYISVCPYNYYDIYWVSPRTILINWPIVLQTKIKQIHLRSIVDNLAATSSAYTKKENYIRPQIQNTNLKSHNYAFNSFFFLCDVFYAECRCFVSFVFIDLYFGFKVNILFFFFFILVYTDVVAKLPRVVAKCLYFFFVISCILAKRYKQYPQNKER